jgi:hypothetical protein
MRQSYTAFQFAGQTFHENIENYKLLNATLSNEFYADCLRGSRSILEEKIPGRDIPYFYEIDDEPLEFEVTFAFAESMTKTQIKNIIKKLVAPKTFQSLTFGNYVDSVYTKETPIYKVIFVGEVDLNYVSTGFNESNNEIFIAYITLKARADRPYGFNNISVGSLSSSAVDDLTVTNTGDVEFYPSIEITAVATTANWIRVRNSTAGNGSTITFKGLTNNEAIVVNANLKTISSSVSGIYTRWNRDDLYLDAGTNSLVVEQSSDSGLNWTTYSTGVKLKVSGEAPVYVYDTN